MTSADNQPSSDYPWDADSGRWNNPELRDLIEFLKGLDIHPEMVTWTRGVIGTSFELKLLANDLGYSRIYIPEAMSMDHVKDVVLSDLERATEPYGV